MKNYGTFATNQIADAFRNFAEDECKGSSHLYYTLCNKISEDTDLLGIACEVRYGQPIPNSFLASVHFLLLESPADSLAQYYPTIAHQAVDEIPFELFKTFVFENKERILKLIETRIVQTNVINRCSYLAPAFSKIINNDHGKSITVIDIGTSAGLTLNWDKYEYQYNGGPAIGKSEVKVKVEVRESAQPQFNLSERKIRKIGIDQHIVDPTNAEDARWLRALVWPDHVERCAGMNEALAIEDLNAIEFIEAQTVRDFGRIISTVDQNDLLIIYCTHAMYQFPTDMREAFWKMLDDEGSRRDFYFFSAEGIKSQREKYNTEHSVVELTSYLSGVKTQTLIAEANSHGNWFIWRAH